VVEDGRIISSSIGISLGGFGELKFFSPKQL